MDNKYQVAPGTDAVMLPVRHSSDSIECIYEFIIKIRQEGQKFILRHEGLKLEVSGFDYIHTYDRLREMIYHEIWNLIDKHIKVTKHGTPVHRKAIN